MEIKYKQIYIDPDTFTPRGYAWWENKLVFVTASMVEKHDQPVEEIIDKLPVLMDCNGTSILSENTDNEEAQFRSALRIYGLVKQLTLAGIEAKYIDTPTAVVDGRSVVARSMRIDKEQAAIQTLLDNQIKTVYVHRVNCGEVLNPNFHTPMSYVMWRIAEYP